LFILPERGRERPGLLAKKERPTSTAAKKEGGTSGPRKKKKAVYLRLPSPKKRGGEKKTPAKKKKQELLLCFDKGKKSPKEAPDYFLGGKDNINGLAESAREGKKKEGESISTAKRRINFVKKG